MNDTVIFLVLAGLALIFKWLTNKGSSDPEKPRPTLPNETPRHAPPQTDEERVRRFLEALGVPPGTQPPPPVRSRTVMPRPVATATPPAPPPKVKRSWVQPLPPVVTTPPDVPSPPLTTPWQPEPIFVMESKPTPPANLPPPLPAQLSVAPSPAPSTPKVAPTRVFSTASLRPLLHSREAVRRAIVLREVLGPAPGLDGLQPLGRFQGR